MNVVNKLCVASALTLMPLMLSGCVVHDREVVHDSGGYNQGYKEGYYDSQRHRWWHNNAWQDCAENDVHCHD